MSLTFGTRIGKKKGNGPRPEMGTNGPQMVNVLDLGSFFKMCAILGAIFSHLHVYTEQMDAEGLGRGLLLTPLGTPRKSLKADRRCCDGVSQNANPASTFELSQCRHCKERHLGQGEAFG